MRNIVEEVMDYIDTHCLKVNSERPTDFETYDDAFNVVWPELYKACPNAALLVSISIYVDIAERWGFEVIPPEIKDVKL
jgi:hypothetical protein